MPGRRIAITVGDLTEQDVDAIVNAANNDLVLGAGVAGAIRRRGGPTIQDECTAHGPVRVGEAAITGAGQLKARHVIHAASMALGGRTTATSLHASMTATFEIARRSALDTVAVPAVGTGIAGFPLDECARIMAMCLGSAFDDGWEPSEVRFVLYDEAAHHAFEPPFLTAFRAVRGHEKHDVS
ncbi:MAG TPA: macro domain-containing protein [Candidatus Dormibacteraeota bacterium]|nr:macro domain-containing protein [Candidatus Dormibacteraeota bacterium]